MAKIIEEVETKKKSTLEKITEFFKGQAIAEVVADEEEAKKEEDDDTAAKTTGEDDEKDPDDDKDDDTDPDKDEDDDDATMEVNGAVINLKNVEETRAAIESLVSVNATQNELLQAAAAELGKTKEQVKNEIKSSFTPPSSQRSTKAVGDKEKISDSFLPTKGSRADKILNIAIAKNKK